MPVLRTVGARRYVWQPWELQLLAHLKQRGIGNPALAEYFGVPFDHLTWTLRVEKIKSRQNWRDIKDKVKDLLTKGYSTVELATMLNLKPVSVYAALNSHGILPPGRKHVRRNKANLEAVGEAYWANMIERSTVQQFKVVGKHASRRA